MDNLRETFRSWPRWAQIALPAAVVIIVIGLIVAPGPDPAKKKQSTTAAAAIKGPGSAYAACAAGIGLTVTRQNATHLQTRSAKGTLVANTTVLATPPKAEAFAAGLPGSDHTQGGRTVTEVKKSVTGAVEARAILGCARKG